MVSLCAMPARGSGVLTLEHVNVRASWRWRTTHASQVLLQSRRMEEKKQRIDAARRITRSLGHRGETLEANVIWLSRSICCKGSQCANGAKGHIPFAPVRFLGKQSWLPHCGLKTSLASLTAYPILQGLLRCFRWVLALPRHLLFQV